MTSLKHLKLEVLSQEEIESIHQKALEVLEKVGITVFEPEAVKLLGDMGAKIEGKKVYFPSSLVEESIEKAPKEFTVHARNEKHNVEMQVGKVFFEPMIGRVNVLDWRTGEKRRTNINDAGDLVKLADALDNYHILHSGSIMPSIEGIPAGTSHVHGYLQGIKNSSKVIKGSCRGKKVAQDCIEMASIWSGIPKEKLYQKPNIFTTCNIISPLKLDEAQTQGLMVFAKYGLPVDITSEPQLGSTSPVSLAGALVQQTAEVLSGIVVAQSVNPGTPVWFGTCAGAMDMKTGSIALGGVEGALINIAHAQLANYYQIPSRGTGCNTESKTLDMQAGYEKAITLILTAMAGNSMIFYPGTIEHALTIDYLSLVVDNEICGMVKRIVEGIDVNDETMAFELIKQVGSDGHYLGKKHTLVNLKKEFYMPVLSNRESRETWIEKGKKGVVDRAREKVEKILTDYHPDPLKTDIEEKLKEYIKEVERRESNRS